jgi:hypothetical protein
MQSLEAYVAVTKRGAGDIAGLKPTDAELSALVEAAWPALLEAGRSKWGGGARVSRVADGRVWMRFDDGKTLAAAVADTTHFLSVDPRDELRTPDGFGGTRYWLSSQLVVPFVPRFWGAL